MYAHLALLVVVVLLLRSVAAATRQHEIAALETLYEGTGGSAGRWTFLRMNDIIRNFAVNAATFVGSKLQLADIFNGNSI